MTIKDLKKEYRILNDDIYWLFKNYEIPEDAIDTVIDRYMDYFLKKYKPFEAAYAVTERKKRKLQEEE